jgi:hypothetical protein
MFFWFREIAGWALLALSLYIISIAINFVGSRQVIEAGITLSAALLVMRCGMLLIRLNTVARITLLDDRRRKTPENRS